MKPFLRWAGGKRQILPMLLDNLPKDIHLLVYHEPFLGAGSLFLALLPHKAILSDLNKDLINCFYYIKTDPEEVGKHLYFFQEHTTKADYYKIRNDYNEGCISAIQAARFIFLNKTCYNGIFRVNMQGKFNVPYGSRNHPTLPNYEELMTISNVLKGVTLSSISYERAISETNINDFVYLDPPYPPLNGTSYFNHYTVERFPEEEQFKLAREVISMDIRGVKFMMTNSDTELIRDLYSQFNMVSIPVTRFITCKSTRHQVSELVIKNY